MIYVDPFLGAGAAWLANLDETLVPLVSWMGGKRRLACDLLALLGLRPGRPVPAMLGDASWWGWVWPVVLDDETGPRVSAILRRWRDEDPRALWFRLRDLGPVEESAEAAAQLLWLQARAASGVPVWWAEEVLRAAPGDGRESQRAADRGSNGPRKGRSGGGYSSDAAWQTGGHLVQWASTKIDAAGQRQATEPPRLLSMDGHGRGPPPRVVATSRSVRVVQAPGLPFEAGHKGTDSRGGGIVDPGTIADRADRIRARLVKASGGEAGFGYDDGFRRGKGWRAFVPADAANRADRIRAACIGDVRIEHRDAGSLTDEWAPRLGAAACVYLDPPYQGATGYPVTCDRSEVLRIAETWARNGARVVLSEAVGLASELGSGWSDTCLRRDRKPEWVTTHGCDVQAIVPPLLRRSA
jgi:hypothetical protein